MAPLAHLRRLTWAPGPQVAYLQAVAPAYRRPTVGAVPAGGSFKGGRCPYSQVVCPWAPYPQGLPLRASSFSKALHTRRFSLGSH
ncbi:hypothetical protein BHE74_00050643 [Ensete ventricosum]|nr:hypothetical protein BHE74_00050643 [Ensete ventricosum]